MTRYDKITWRLLLIAAVINIICVIAFYIMGRAVIFLVFLTFGIPLLLPPILVVWALCRILRRKEWRMAIPELLGCAGVLLLPVIYTFVVYPLMNRQVFFFELPDGTEMTVWEDYIVFEHYNRFRAPKDNYIYMGEGQYDYAISISNAGEMSVWVFNNADEIKVSNPRFPLVGIYEDWKNGGMFWFNKETPIRSTWVNLKYNYMRDGLASTGNYDYEIVLGDSMVHQSWYFPNCECYLLKKDDALSWVLPLDSVAHRDSINMARDMKYHHYQDSVQHSQLSVTYPQKGTNLWQ